MPVSDLSSYLDQVPWQMDSASYLSQAEIYSFRRLRRVAFLPVVFLPFFFSMRRRVDAFRPGWTFPRRVRRRPPSIPPAPKGALLSSGILFTTPENLRRRQGSDVPRAIVSVGVGPGVRRGWRDRVVRPTPAHLEATHQGRLTTRGLHALLLQHPTEGPGLEGATRAAAAHCCCSSTLGHLPLLAKIRRYTSSNWTARP